MRLDPDRIFVREGRLWTSAGITAGIDLSLALIGEDLGEAVARRTAQHLVVYHRRPGGQSQFSALLEMESSQGRFAALFDHLRTHLAAPLTVERLAARACMSPRHFARAFHEETGVTPAKAVERLRADAARAMLESGARSVQAVAEHCGFHDPERMRRAFLRLFGAPPSAMKRAQRERGEPRAAATRLSCLKGIPEAGAKAAWLHGMSVDVTDRRRLAAKLRGVVVLDVVVVSPEQIVYAQRDTQVCT